MVTSLTNITIESSATAPSAMEAGVLELLEIDNPGLQPIRDLGWRSDVYIEDNNRRALFHDGATTNDYGVKDVVDVMIRVDTNKVVGIVNDESPSRGVIANGFPDSISNDQVAGIRAVKGEAGDRYSEVGRLRVHGSHKKGDGGRGPADSRCKGIYEIFGPTDKEREDRLEHELFVVSFEKFRRADRGGREGREY